MYFQFLGNEIIGKDHCNVFASETVEWYSLDCKDIISLRISNNKEVGSILRLREVRNEDLLLLWAIESFQIYFEHSFSSFLQALILQWLIFVINWHHWILEVDLGHSI